jgi:capsular exopolysaccharide synthesis family protein
MEFQSYFSIAKRRKTSAAIAFIVVFGLGVLTANLKKPIYEAQGKLLYKISNIVPNGINLSESKKDNYDYNSQTNPLTTQSEIILSGPIIAQAVNQLNQGKQQNQVLTTKEFKDSVRVQNIAETDILLISYRDRNPQQAAAAVNTLMSVFLENNTSATKTEVIATRQLLEKDLSQAKKKLIEAEKALREFKEQNQVFSVDTEAVTIRETIAQLQKQIVEAKSELAKINRQSQVLEQKLEIGQLEQQLKVKLIDLQAIAQGLTRQIAELSAAEGNYRQRIKRLPQLEQEFSALYREVQIARSRYSSLSEKLEQQEIAHNENRSNFQIVASAIEPEKPIPLRSLFYLTSGLLALAIAIGTVYFLEMIDQSIKTVEEARKIFGYTWLGVIPGPQKSKLLSLLGKEQKTTIPPLIVRERPASAISESYRMLQSNLKFLNSDQKFKTIVVTSSVAQEGKSTIAANLATAMAQVGHRVLLLDADLHHPTQHHIWEVDSDRGLTHILAEQLDPPLAIKQVMPYLDLIPAGFVPSSPLTLLDSQTMSTLMTYLSRQYDFVIIDSPALDFAADASIIGRIADGMLLVVKLGVVDLPRANFAKEILDNSGKQVLGMVVNGVNSEIEPHPYHYQLVESQQQTNLNFKLLGSSDSLEPSQSPIKEDKILSIFSQQKDKDRWGRVLGVSQTQEQLWDALLGLEKESAKRQPIFPLDRKQLEQIPTDKLEEIIKNLQRDLHNLTEKIQEQEQELAWQNRKVIKLENQINSIINIEQANWPEKLAQEKERKLLLEETLIAQRENLEKKETILRQLKQVLVKRQNRLKPQ